MQSLSKSDATAHDDHQLQQKEHKKRDPAINKYLSPSTFDGASSQWSSDTGLVGQNLKYI